MLFFKIRNFCTFLADRVDKNNRKGLKMTSNDSIFAFTFCTMELIVANPAGWLTYTFSFWHKNVDYKIRRNFNCHREMWPFQPINYFLFRIFLSWQYVQIHRQWRVYPVQMMFLNKSPLNKTWTLLLMKLEGKYWIV